MQYGIRNRLVKLMRGWQGRQVAQPSLEKKIEAAKEKVQEKVEESGVLVPEGQ